MFPMRPEDAAMLAHRHQHELRERVARERLVVAGQPRLDGGDRVLARTAGVARRFWAGARNVLRPHPARPGTTG